MASKSTSRDERIDVRVNSESKSLFLRAAELSGQNLSAFIIEAVRERAIQTIEAHDQVVLNNQSRQVFLDALAKPPAPTEALRRAADKYAMK